MNRYSAQTAYQHSEAASGYLARPHYASWLGRWRRRIEQRAVEQALDDFPDDLVLLDCPCGAGRWLPVIARKAREIFGMDISKVMVDHASQVDLGGRPSRFSCGGAEQMDLSDGSVDLVFSFALTKHLPPENQALVLREFGRVARKGVICTFSTKGWVSAIRSRQLAESESYPLSRAMIEQIAEKAGLRLKGAQRCSTIFGMERLYWFKKY